MPAVTAQNSTFVAKVNAERVRRGPWNGALILEGGQKDPIQRRTLDGVSKAARESIRAC